MLNILFSHEGAVQPVLKFQQEHMVYIRFSQL